MGNLWEALSRVGTMMKTHSHINLSKTNAHETQGLRIQANWLSAFYRKHSWISWLLHLRSTITINRGSDGNLSMVDDPRVPCAVGDPTIRGGSTARAGGRPRIDGISPWCQTCQHVWSRGRTLGFLVALDPVGLLVVVFFGPVIFTYNVHMKVRYPQLWWFIISFSTRMVSFGGVFHFHSYPWYIIYYTITTIGKQCTLF
jgi:hypothetical protein